MTPVKENDFLKSFIALLIGIFVSLILSEIILQILHFPSRPVSGWLNCQKKHPGQCNEMGFRGREIEYSDSDYVVILLGDSEVYAPALPFDQRPENRLEHYLKRHKNNVKVFTLGDMGYGQDQQYLALQKYFEEFRADLVLLMFTARNDIENNLFPTSGLNYSIKPTFWLNDGELQGPTEGLLEPTGPRSKLVLFWQRYIGDSTGESLLKTWEKKMLPLPYQPLSHYEGEVDDTWDEIWKTDPQNAYKGIEYERVGPANQFAPRSAMRDYGIKLTRKLFAEMTKLIKANNGHFVIFKEERPWELQEKNREKAYFLNGRYYRISMTQYEDTLNDLFTGFEHYRVPLRMENVDVKEEDVHLNQEAVDMLMRELAGIIAQKNYFRKNQKLNNYPLHPYGRRIKPPYG